MTAGLSDIQLNIIVNVRNAASINALNNTLSGIASRQAGMAKSAQAAAAGTRALSTEANTLKSRLDNVEKNFDALFRASYRLMNVGYQLVNASKAIFGAITDMTDAWGKFEFTLNRAAGALQIWKGSADAVNPVYESLISNLLSTTKQLRLFPAEEVARATYYWGSTTGQTVRNLNDLKVVMSAIQPLMEVSALTQTSYEAAIKGTYSIITQYGKSLNDVGDITSKLFLVTQRTALEYGDLINSFKYVGPTAHALGISFEEVAQVLGALGDAGIRGSMSGRALRQMFIRLVKPPKEAADALNALFLNTNSLGKSFDELVFPNGKFVGITKYVDLLAQALQHATVAQRNHVYAISSTANELPVITALVENQIKVLNGQAGAYDNAKSSVTDAANAALQFKQNWDLLSNSWVGLTERLKRGVEVIKIQVGRILAGALAESVQKLTDFLDRVESWVKRNPAIVKSLGQFGAALGAIAGIAGGMFLLSGALLGVYAAVNVIIRGFGPLAGAAGAVIGAIAVLGESIVTNWGRIQREIVPAINRFVAALVGGQGSIAGVAEEWRSLHETLRTIADFIVKTAITVLHGLLDMMTAIADSPLRPVLEAIGKALVAALGVRALAYVTGLSFAFTKFLQIVMIAKAGAIGMAIQMRLMGATSLIATRGVGGLTVALQTMSKTQVLLIITGIILAIQTLSDLMPRAGKSLDDLKSSMDDFYSSLGDKAKSAQNLISQSVENLVPGINAQITAYQKEFDRIHGMLQPGDVIGHALIDWAPVGGLSDLKKNMEAAERIYEEKANHFREVFQQVADDTERNITDVYDFVSRYGTSLFGDITKDNGLEKSARAARAYFNELKDGTELTAEGAVKMWNALTAQGDQPNMSKRSFLNTFVSQAEQARVAAESLGRIDMRKAQAALNVGNFSVAYKLLNTLKTDAASYGPEFNQVVTNMLAGIPQATSQVMQDAVGLMDKAPGEMLTALQDAFKKVGNIKDRFKEALKNKVNPKDLVTSIIGDINSPQVKQALTSNNVSMNLWGQQVIDDAYTSFTTAVAAYTSSGKTGQLVTAIEKAIGPSRIRQIVSGSFTKKGGKWWGSLSADQQYAFQQYADWWAEQVGLVTPSGLVVEGVQEQWRSKAQKLFEAEFVTPDRTTPKQNDPIAPLIEAMKTSLTSGQDAVSSFKEIITGELSDWSLDGENPMTGFAHGMNTAFTNAVLPATKNIASTVGGYFIGNSPPPLGPLAKIEVGGAATMVAWSKGALAAIGFVLINISKITRAVVEMTSSTSLRQSMESGGYRVMSAWIDGMNRAWKYKGLPALTAHLIAAKANLIGASPPPEGPLKNIDVGGYNIMKAWAGGITAGGIEAARAARGASSMVHQALDVQGLGGANPITFNASNQKLIKVQVDVKSSDGSVSGVDMSDLSEALIPELVRNLEMAAAS